ncbi:unnamed protein product [Dovyalis caffra]|uniref:Uncharacterized protein n=1 Tax=Dovyalis caffra TaxID=77055 RepID=A0AAV1R1W5_9ROSI|nr:unnamed protein product [Dovyalis caffra]
MEAMECGWIFHSIKTLKKLELGRSDYSTQSGKDAIAGTILQTMCNKEISMIQKHCNEVNVEGAGSSPVCIEKLLGGCCNALQCKDLVCEKDKQKVLVDFA